MPAIDPAQVRARLDAVIAAMQAIGAWDVARPRDEAFVDMGAFGMRAMAFEQWLRYVFVSRVEELIASNGPWPSGSAVSAHATREFDGHPDPDGLLRALRAFDALFAAEPSPSPVAEAYEHSRAAFARGDHAAALELIRAALAADASFPNAHNFAGWVLLHLPARTAADLDAAIAEFRAAIAVAPDDAVPLVNLCDALFAAGRFDDAIAEAERGASGSRTAGAHNWLGWYFMQKPETIDRAIEHLQRAITSRASWGVARANLAKALELAHRSDDAYEQLAIALRCDDDFDRAFCHERIGAYEARRGWFRNALGSMRAAVREDDVRGAARRAPYAEAIAWIEQQLRAAGIEPVPPEHERDEAWTRACELEKTGEPAR